MRPAQKWRLSKRLSCRSIHRFKHHFCDFRFAVLPAQKCRNSIIIHHFRHHFCGFRPLSLENVFWLLFANPISLSCRTIKTTTRYGMSLDRFFGGLPLRCRVFWWKSPPPLFGRVVFEPAAQKTFKRMWMETAKKAPKMIDSYAVPAF